MKHASPVSRARSFGLSVGGVLVGLALLLVWRGRAGRAEIVGANGAVLVVLGGLRPALLTIPSNAWWAFATVLGWINARVILSVAFFLILSPLSLVWRLVGQDPLARRRDRFPGWSPHPARYRDSRHYERMF